MLSHKREGLDLLILKFERLFDRNRTCLVNKCNILDYLRFFERQRKTFTQTMVSSSLYNTLNFESFFLLPPDVTEKELPRCQDKNVVFYERVKVLEIPSAKYLSIKEKAALWYDYSEPEESNPKASVIRKLLCVVIDDHRDEWNEQEDEDDQGFDHPEERKNLPVSVVLMEQKSQRESGMKDNDFIAKIYRQCSAYSTMKAQIRAMQDEQEAREYASKDSRGRLRSSKLLRRVLVR